MSNIPRHMYILSKVYWEIVDALTKNGFYEKEAQNVAIKFFKQFSPLPRKNVDDVGSSSMRIVYVKVLRGRAKEEADKQGLKPNDLVIVTTRITNSINPEYHIEKVEGDPISYLLKRAKDCE